MRLKRNQTHRNGQAGLATFPGYVSRGLGQVHEVVVVVGWGGWEGG